MNQTFDQAPANPWDKRENFPRLQNSNLALALIALFLSSLGVGCGSNEIVSMILLPLLLIYAVTVGRAPTATVPLLLVALLTSLLTFSISGATVALSLILGAATFAFLLASRRLPYLTLAVPLAGVGISFLLTGSLALALLALSFLPAGALLSYASCTQKGRTSSIVWTQAGFLISLVALLAYTVYQTQGSVSASAISAALEGVRYAVLDLISFVKAELLAELSTAAQGFTEAEIKELTEALNTLLSESTVNGLISQLYGILPGITVALCGILSYEAQLFLNLTYLKNGWKQVVTPATCVFTMSLTAAVLYLLGFVVLLFFGSYSIFTVLMQNVCIMLLPGFCVLGFWNIRLQIKMAKGGGKVFLILLTVLALCCVGFSALYILAILGASSVILGALQRKIQEKTKQG
ncbi:MAG: hypothetical protein IJX13_01200 [Clostridia bacterium]|nr:hypothetical protein [Clostridia bacterium]